MAFEDLTETQQKFIQTYFKTKLFNSKAKDLALNADFEKAASAVYREVNRLKALIDKVGAEHEHAPVAQYESALDEQTAAMEKILNDNKKAIKKGNVPSFDPVTAGLAALDERINARLKQIESGKGIDGRTADKEKSATEMDLEIRKHEREAEDLFRDAMRQMQVSPKDDLAARSIAIQRYRDAKTGAIAAINAIVDKDAADSGVTLEAFNAKLQGTFDTFTAAAAPQLKVITDLLAALPIDPVVAYDTMAARPEFLSLETVMRADQRTEAAAASKAKIDGFVTDQTKALNTLKDDFANAKDKDAKAAARAAYEAKQAQLAVLQMRQDQLRKFAENEETRKKALVEAVMTVEGSDALANDIFDQLDDTPIKMIPELQEMVFAFQETPMARMIPGPDVLTKQIEDWRKEVDLATQKEVIMPKLDGKETPVMQLEPHEARVLNALLDLAEHCVADLAPQQAMALIEKVRSDKAAYMRARTALALPPPEPPEPGPLKKIYKQLDFYESELRDLIALAVVGAEDKLDEVLALRAQLKVADDAGDVADLTPFSNEADALGKSISNLPAPPPPSAAFVAAKADADKTHGEVSAILDGLLRTEKITDKDIIEVPNREYSKAELANLVRSDEIITVEVSPGVFEKHKILQHRKGKGGQDLARREDKKIPREATNALRQKADALKYMSESGSSDCAEVMEAYRKQVEDFAADIRDNGDDLYPQVEAEIKACDKLFEKGTMSKFIPADFGKVKAPYDAFKESWRSKGPTEALKIAKEHHTKVTQLELDAKGVEKMYETCIAEHKKIIADLSGKKNKSDDANPLGKMVKEALKKSPDDFFAEAAHMGDKALFDQIQKAKEDFVKLQAWYKKYPNVAKNELCGDWMTKAGNAHKKLDSKEDGNIKEAKADLDAIRIAMKDFDDRMAGISSAKGPDAARLLIELTNLMAASTKDVVKRHNEQLAFEKLDKALIEKIKAGATAGAKKSKNPIAKDILDRLTGMNTRRKSLVATTKADETYRSGLATLEGYEREIDELVERLGEAGNQKGEKIKNMRVGNKADVLDDLLGKMSEKAKKLTPDTISKYVPDPANDPTGIGANAAVVGANLDKVSQLPSLAQLTALGKTIDALNVRAEAGDSTKADRIKEREKALAEIRKFRGAFDAHPAIKLYRDNPFDMGTDVRLVQTALHQVEISVLACVSPREVS